jgi:uncharacterized protein YjbI with pentapeptide repeats
VLSNIRSFWQKVKKPLEITVLSIFVVGLIALIVLVILGTIFQWNWTGFGLDTTDPKQHAKTLWDWLQLLIIPAVLAIGGYVFNLTASRNEQQSTQLRDQTEREITADNQQEAALQTYIDKVSELLLEKQLRESAQDDEVRNIARVRTLTVLPRLDSARKRSILQFLYESGLLKKEKCILDLTGADLSGTNLRLADLREADLTGAILKEADLRGCDLSEAILKETDLSGANLWHVYLRGVDLSEANLSSANLVYVHFREADLAGANLSKADLREADLREADLTGASLKNAELKDANFTGAILRFAILTGAKSITSEQLDQAQSLQKATLPDGSKHA